jgi:hypothetical protein
LALLDSSATENKSVEKSLASTVREQPEVTRWGPAWRQRLVVTSLVFSDILVAVLICSVAYALQSVWGQGTLSEVASAATVPSIAVWIGLRALLGLYPGYGLDSVERLRRHVYSVGATAAILAIFAVGAQIGGLLSRLMLLLTFVGLLLVTPFSQYLIRRELKRLKLWGKPIIIVGYPDTRAKLVDHLEQEWGLGYQPVSLSDYHLTPAGEAFRAIAYAEALAEAREDRSSGGRPTSLHSQYLLH